MEDMFNIINISSYSVKQCEMYRYNQFLLKKCNCTDPSFTFMKNNNYCLSTVQSGCAEGVFYEFYTNSKHFINSDNICRSR